MRECIEEGILQSYVDGELSPDMTERVAAHLAACSTCAEALDEINNEMAMFATAFESEMALDVPTVRLRERLDAAIAEMNPPSRIAERKQAWSLSGWFASFTELFKVSPQRAIGFASLIAIVAFAAIFAAIRLNRSGKGGDTPQFIANSNNAVPANPIAVSSPSPSPENNPNSKGNNAEPKDKPTNQKAPKKQSRPILVPQPDQLGQGELATKQSPPKPSQPLPGEQNYLKAIDSLSTEIAASDATAMKPSLRVEYERNLAVIDQAIDSTRRVARRNPKDPDAVQFLYSSYQSKLDLLSTVAEQVRPTVATR